jgi:hypothetical protein
MQLVYWQGLATLAEELQCGISLDQADSAVIRLDRINNTLVNLGQHISECYCCGKV